MISLSNEKNLVSELNTYYFHIRKLEISGWHYLDASFYNIIHPIIETHAKVQILADDIGHNQRVLSVQAV